MLSIILLLIWQNINFAFALNRLPAYFVAVVFSSCSL